MVRDVIVDLGGQPHILRSDLGAWAAIEDTGQDYLALLTSLSEPKPKMRAILTLLWGYLDHEQPRPSLTEVGHWVTAANFTTVTKAIRDAYVQGAPEVTTPPGPRLADDGTGPSSASWVPASKSRRKASGG